MDFGYARTSGASLDLDRQVESLKERGIADENIYADETDGPDGERPAYEYMLTRLGKGDTLTVCSLDRLAHSTGQLRELAEGFARTDVTLVSLKEDLDTATPEGKFFSRTLSDIAEFERELRDERQAAARAARENDRPYGRSRTDQEKLDEAIRLYEEGAMPVADIAGALGISRATIYNEVKRRDVVRRRG